MSKQEKEPSKKELEKARKKTEAELEREQKKAAAEKRKAEKAAVEEERKAEKRAREKKDAEKEEAKAPEIPCRDADLSAGAQAVQAAIAEMAENPEFEVTVSGEGSGPVALRLPAGLKLRWRAVLTGSSESGGALLRLEAEPEQGKNPPAFELEEPGRIEDEGPGGLALRCVGETLTTRAAGGTIRSARGNAIEADGTVVVCGGRVEAFGEGEGSASAIRAPRTEITDGLVFARARPSDIRKKGDSLEAEFLRPFDPKSLKEGSGVVVAWATEDESAAHANGSERDLLCLPEDAGAWWENDDGWECVWYGRGDNFGRVRIAPARLPASVAPADATTDAVRKIFIPFRAKTPDGERVVDLEIEWGWDLFLGKKGSEEYDNRIAIAACALCNAAYSPDDIQDLMTRLGFTDVYLGNTGMLNATSAYILGRHHIEGANKTVFAVVNRGSQTLTDWKGNIVSETIQQSGYFSQSAKQVDDALVPYARESGADPEDSVFLITGHSLGGVVTDILAATDMDAFPGKNVYAYTFAAPLADASIEEPKDRPIYNIINQKDIVTSIPPRLSYHRLGSDNYGFVPSSESSDVLADRFRFLSHMDIRKLEEMNAGLKGIFKRPVQTIMWNHSLTTYMAYLLAGGPKEIKREGFFLWNLLQNR